MYPMIIGVVAVLVVLALLFIVLPMLINNFSALEFRFHGLPKLS